MGQTDRAGGSAGHSERLSATLSELAEVPASECAYLEGLLHRRPVEKGGFFLREGDYPILLAYIQRGLFRVFFTTESGNERTHAFRAEERFLSGYSPFLGRVRSPYSIQALEEGVLPQ